MKVQLGAIPGRFGVFTRYLMGSREAKLCRRAKNFCGAMETKGVILVADSDRETAPVMDIALHHLELPYQLVNMSNGQEVIRYLQREGRYAAGKALPFPDLLLLDLGIKQVDALDVLRWIRRSPEARHLNVIVLAESVFDSDVARAYKEGANSFLVKAYGFAAILEQLREIDHEWLRKRRPLPAPEKRPARRRGKATRMSPRTKSPGSAAPGSGAGGILRFGGPEGLGAQAAL